MSDTSIKLSIVIPVLNSHEIVRRQIIHYRKMNLPDTAEIIFVDDGSDPPIECPEPLRNFFIYQTNDKREWTWALARNFGAKKARGEYLLMTDIDYIIPRAAIDSALSFDGDKMRFKREFGVLDENGNFTQDHDVLMKYGLSPKRIAERGVHLPPHPNNFVMKKSVFLEMGGYVEDRIGRPYPQGEDREFKRRWMKYVEQGKYKDSEYRPTIYMFPNGQYCGDVDYNPFNLFHDLSRKTEENPYIKRTASHNDLTVVIPGRNEIFMAKTIENILQNIRGDTKVIAVCDGYWPEPPIYDHPRVTVLHYTQSVGQRAATNDGIRLARTKFVMKCDAHCAFDEGFDVKLMQDCEYDWTVVPRLYNLHAFDWACKCGWRQYQGPKPDKCPTCEGTDVEMEVIWKPRWNRRSDFSRFDNNMRFQYWGSYGRRPEAQGDISDLMCHVGACWFIHRDRFWELEGLDESHGSWGQMGVEISCKSWLSGGRQVVNKKTWYSHMFRTKGGFSFPYPISGNDQERAREYSRDLWMKNKWPKQTRNLEWLLDKFKPVPDWHEEVVA